MGRRLSMMGHAMATLNHSMRVPVQSSANFRPKRLMHLLCAAIAIGCSMASYSQQAWVVRPEWVQAHEDFLASDALHGRGSATRDEQIAAEYVASEFLAYGLKLAPGMSTMIQPAEVIAPELDGKATLEAAGKSFAEGPSLVLIIASGESVSGPLLHVPASKLGQAPIAKGSVVLITDLPEKSDAMRLAFKLRGSGAALILFAQDKALAGYRTMLGGKTRIQVRLKPAADQKVTVPPTIAAVDASSFAALTALPDGTAVDLQVHRLPSPPRQTFNAIGYLPGTDPAAATLLLSAHLDHLGIGAAVNGDTIYNGANDDAAGTTGVLELAHALASGAPLRRSILFVCYGSEELGELGSTYFGQHLPIPLSQLVANLEFEMIGARDPKMPKDTLLLTGWDRSNLGPTLRDHGAKLGPDPYPEEHFFERSDNYQLALKGVVAHTAAGWGTVHTYHQPNDDLAHIDIPFMTTAIQSLVEPMRWLADSDFKPAWNAGGQPKR